MPKKILLADDSITIQKVVELTFSEGDYQVFAVGNGALALRKVHEVRPDIALLDVIMPEASGYEVCEKLKRDPDTSRIPVLLLTGTFEPFDRRRADAAGADGHLTKPFESQVLIARVEELIASSLPALPAEASVEPQFSAEAAEPEVVTEVQESASDAGAEEEMSRQAIVPDRYDEFMSREESARAFGVEEPSNIPAPRAPSGPEAGVNETWDELASGLASAPEGNGSEAAEMGRSSAEEGISIPIHEIPSGALSSSEAPPPFAAGPSADEAGNGLRLSAEQLDHIASRVVERLSDRVVRDIAWEIIPELAETLIRQRIRELEEKITREG